jgi:type IV pilus assembly protein PilQ
MVKDLGWVWKFGYGAIALSIQAIGVTAATAGLTQPQAPASSTVPVSVPPPPPAAPAPIPPAPTAPLAAPPAIIPPTMAPAPPLPAASPDSSLDFSITLPNVDLGTSDVIDRLVLRESSVREALALLARTAGLGIVFTEDLTAPPAGAAGAPAPVAQLATTISLDIENESVQSVFNYILKAKGLRAVREGKTLFVGQTLPASAGNYIARTLRLSQMKASLPQTNITTTLTSASSLTSGGGQGGSNTSSQVGRSSTTTENVPNRGALQTLEDLGANGTPTAKSRIFGGLQATADARTNTLTLLGTPETVQLATDYILKLDTRRKQVAVNVKIVEVNLNNNSNVGASFSFGIADSFFTVNQGQATANFGAYNPSLANSNSLTSPGTIANPFAGVQPPLDVSRPISNADGATVGFQPANPTNSNPLAPVVSNLTTGSIVTSNNVTTVLNPAITYGLSPLFQFPLQFLARLQAQVVSGNAKILTDPTLIVQEGSRSQVNLTSQVFSGFTEQRITEGNVTTTRILPQPPIDVGVILNIEVDRIDDSSFITLAVSPEVSSPGQQILDPSRNNLLIQQLVNRRRLETGTIRLRDGQTLILTGIIQQQDRTITTKTPILGDIPLLNLLFRNTRKERDRSEVIILVTPQVLNDFNQSPYGANYLPGPELQRFLQQGQPRR